MKIKLNKKAMITLGVASALGAAVFAGYGKKEGVIDSCTATYQTYVTAHYSETYLTTCSSTDANGNWVTRACMQTRYWSNPASPVWTTRTVNNDTNTNAPETYLGNHGFPLHDLPPRDQSLSQHSDFDNFRNNRSIKHDVAVLMAGDYQTFDKEPSAYKGCNLMRKQKSPSTIKTWYGIAYDTEIMI